MDGYRVMPMPEAVRISDVLLTVTGNTAVIRREHFEIMKDRAIVGNSGHFNVEIDLPALADLAVERRPVREHVEEFRLPDGRRSYVLAGRRPHRAEGRSRWSPSAATPWSGTAVWMWRASRPRCVRRPRTWPGL